MNVEVNDITTMLTWMKTICNELIITDISRAQIHINVDGTSVWTND